MPPESQLDSWLRDYQAMRANMFYGEPPTWPEILQATSATVISGTREAGVEQATWAGDSLGGVERQGRPSRRQADRLRADENHEDG